MNTPDDRRSGVILPFTPRAARRPQPRGPLLVAAPTPPAVETCASHGSWYHELALAEADRTRKP